MNNADVVKTCVECQQDFVWTAGEQAFFAEHDLTIPPRRCQPCRRARKAARQWLADDGPRE